MTETIARLLMVLVGFAVAMLGIIYAIHSQDVYLGILISVGGVASMLGAYLNELFLVSRSELPYLQNTRQGTR